MAIRIKEIDGCSEKTSSSVRSVEAGPVVPLPGAVSVDLVSPPETLELSGLPTRAKFDRKAYMKNYMKTYLKEYRKKHPRRRKVRSISSAPTDQTPR